MIRGYNSVDLTLRKSSREKDAKNLVASLEKKTEAMRNTFRRTKKAEGNAQAVVATAQQIDSLIYGLRLNPQTTSQWDKIRREISQVSAAFRRPEPFSGNVGSSNEVSCAQDAGAERARRMGPGLSGGFTRNSPAVQCAKFLPVDNRRDQALVQFDRARRAGFLPRIHRGAGVFGSKQRNVSCYFDDGNRRYCDADTRCKRMSNPY